MCIYIYVYTQLCVISLSLYTYIYIYMYTYTSYTHIFMKNLGSRKSRTCPCSSGPRISAEVTTTINNTNNDNKHEYE